MRNTKTMQVMLVVLLASSLVLLQNCRRRDASDRLSDIDPNQQQRFDECKLGQAVPLTLDVVYEQTGVVSENMVRGRDTQKFYAVVTNNEDGAVLVQLPYNHKGSYVYFTLHMVTDGTGFLEPVKVKVVSAEGEREERSKFTFTPPSTSNSNYQDLPEIAEPVEGPYVEYVTTTKTKRSVYVPAGTAKIKIFLDELSDAVKLFATDFSYNEFLSKDCVNYQ